MQLIQILISGAIAGLIAGTLNAIVAPLFLMQVQTTPPWRAQSVVLQLASIGLHLLAGLALALLFWLSWGLIAIVSVTWWQRGLSFALLAWITLSWPLLASQVLQTRMNWPLVAKTACDWLIACMLVGMACAWTWRNGP